MTLRIDSVVVGYDGFERDAPVPEPATRLASVEGATLRLVNVVSELPRSFAYEAPLSPNDLRTAVIEARGHMLEQLATRLAESGSSVTWTVRTGRPHEELIREALEQGSELIVVSDEPQPSQAGLGFGVVTQKLLREAPMAVLASRTRAESAGGRIVAALDVEDWSIDHQSLNQRIVNAAAAMARCLRVPLTLLHGWRIWGSSILERRGHLRPGVLDQLRAQAEATFRARLEQVAAACDLEGVEVDLRLIHGDPGRVLPRLVRDEAVQMVAMGTVSRSGLTGLVIGNTAERIIRDLGCSLLAVKPEGFRSSVAASGG